MMNQNNNINYNNKNKHVSFANQGEAIEITEDEIESYAQNDEPTKTVVQIKIEQMQSSQNEIQKIADLAAQSEPKEQLTVLAQSLIILRNQFDRINAENSELKQENEALKHENKGLLSSLSKYQIATSIQQSHNKIIKKIDSLEECMRSSLHTFDEKINGISQQLISEQAMLLLSNPNINPNAIAISNSNPNLVQNIRQELDPILAKAEYNKIEQNRHQLAQSPQYPDDNTRQAKIFNIANKPLVETITDEQKQLRDSKHVSEQHDPMLSRAKRSRSRDADSRRDEHVKHERQRDSERSQQSQAQQMMRHSSASHRPSFSRYQESGQHQNNHDGRREYKHYDSGREYKHYDNYSRRYEDKHYDNYSRYENRHYDEQNNTARDSYRRNQESEGGYRNIQSSKREYGDFQGNSSKDYRNHQDSSKNNQEIYEHRTEVSRPIEYHNQRNEHTGYHNQRNEHTGYHNQRNEHTGYQQQSRQNNGDYPTSNHNYPNTMTINPSWKDSNTNSNYRPKYSYTTSYRSNQTNTGGYSR